ncbi:MAG: divergent polysaccharide deacetylase family protein [Deltaproteobacteria bacterium]|nr:divergent polysaccharide deacetylase family protein [Deltaproteobacteria bacterium]
MVVKRPRGRKKTARFFRAVFFAFLFAAVFISGGVAFFYLDKRLAPEIKPEKSAVEKKEKEPSPQKKPVEQALPPRPSVKDLPRVAIVIDDMGQNMRVFNALSEVSAPITVAVLPYLAYSKDVAESAHGLGWDVLLHVPMEPKDAKTHDPGKGALLMNMSEDEARNEFIKDLDSVPHIAGVNNHMGSRLTEDQRLMRTVLEVVKQRDIFFLDSRTSDNSVAGAIASQMDVPNVARNVFLDNKQDEGYIKGQIQELLRIAKKQGFAIGIGHSHPETIAALKDTVPDFEKNGVRVVRLSELVDEVR